MTERQKTQFRVKQDEIQHMEKPGTDRGYYLFVEDDMGCLIEQQNRQTVQDTDTDQRLPTDLINEAEASTYQVPEQDDLAIDDDYKFHFHSRLQPRGGRDFLVHNF